MRPKKRLVVAVWTKFMSMKQEIDKPIIKYLHQLWNASRYCDFEKLGQEEQMSEEDLIQLRLIEGMYKASPDRDIDNFEIVAGVLQGDTLAPYLFIICLDYMLRNRLRQWHSTSGKYTCPSQNPT